MYSIQFFPSIKKILIAQQWASMYTSISHKLQLYLYLWYKILHITKSGIGIERFFLLIDQKNFLHKFVYYK